MFRIQSCITFLVLLALSDVTESFTATRKPWVGSTSSTATTTKSSTTVPFLYSARFESNPLDERSSSSSSSSSTAVNNRHSANDYWYNIRTLPGSKVLRDIRNPVLAVFGWSTAVSILHFLLARSGRMALASKLCVSSAAHSFLVSSLGLLLVFRTNSAYQRFNEGRKIWEQILSVSRNLSRLTSLYGREIGSSRRKRVRNLIAAYPYLLRHHIRTGCLCENVDNVDPHHRLLLEEPSLDFVETRHEGDKRCGGSTCVPQVQAPPKHCWVDRRKLPWSLLTPGALDKVSRARNRPLWICDRLGREICDIPYGPNFTNRERQHFLSQVEKLTDAIGNCERIHQTAVPLNYARHSLRTLTLWLFTLPFTLVKDLGVMTGPAAGIIAWLMFGIYQIGYSIEDPFQGSLRLSILCDAIRSDVMGHDYDDNNEEELNTAYTLEQSSWIDDVADQNLPTLLQRQQKQQPMPSPTQIPTKTLAPNQSPVFSMADYEVLEQ